MTGRTNFGAMAGKAQTAMRRAEHGLRGWCAAALAVAGLATLTAASDPGSAGAAEQRPVIEFYSAGLANIGPAPKDAALREAVPAVRARLAELGVETEMPAEQADAILAGFDLLISGFALRVDRSDNGVPTFALTAQPASGRNGAQLAESVAGLLQPSGFVGRVKDGAWPIQTPVGSGQLSTNAGGALTLTINGSDAPGLEVPRWGLSEGVTPILAGRAELSRLGPLLEPFTNMAGPEARAALADNAWTNQTAPTIEFAYGTDERLSHAVVRLRGATQAMGVERRETRFDRARLAWVPRDATRLWAAPLSMSTLLGAIDRMAEQTGSDPLADLSEAVGVDVRGDILKAIGPRSIAYQSDTTGGGGLLSSVFILELADASKFAGTHATLMEKANTLGREQARGYARVRSWDAAGAAAFSLTTPGLPLPIEVSWALHRGHLVLAATPTALLSALGQMDGATTSVWDNAAFQRAVGSRMPQGGAVEIGFVDSERVAGDGYGVVSLAASMVANAGRSPAEPDRVSGPLMPGYTAFMQRIEPLGTVAWWEGEDYLSHTTGDRSALVNMAAVSSMVSGSAGAVTVPALLAGTLLPALGNARESARQLKASTHARSILQAMVIYGQQNNDRPPASVQVLVDEGFLPAELLVSPFGPAADGGPDYGVRLDMGTETFDFNARRIVVIDRASLFTGNVVLVGFADNHVEMVQPWDLPELLDLPVNEGAREALGIPDGF